MEKTIDIMKGKRKASLEVKNRIKEYNKIKKGIKDVLKEGPMTIPQLVEKTRLPGDQLTYYLMTMRKYGIVEAGEVDDMDEYFFYQLVKNK